MSRTSEERPLRYMETVAKMLCDLLEPHCRRIEVAGSIRRRRKLVADIELVAIPIPDRDLYGEIVDPCGSLNRFLAEQPIQLEKDGPKYKRFTFCEAQSGPERPIACDLFLTTKEQWGYILMLRTGDAEFSRRMVTPRSASGLMPNYLRVEGGYVWHEDQRIPVPEEQDLFELWQLDYIPPEERSWTA
jgi:DNA polymerase/3'-5' exonuclease PolX